MKLIKGNQPDLNLTLDNFYSALREMPHGEIGDECIFCNNRANNMFHQMCNNHTNQYRKLRQDLEEKTKESKRLELGIDYSKITDLDFDGIDHSDSPKYCDAYISSGSMDGIELTDDQLEFLNDDTSFVYEKLQDYLY